MFYFCNGNYFYGVKHYHVNRTDFIISHISKGAQAILPKIGSDFLRKIGYAVSEICEIVKSLRLFLHNNFSLKVSSTV